MYEFALVSQPPQAPQPRIKGTTGVTETVREGFPLVRVGQRYQSNRIVSFGLTQKDEFYLPVRLTYTLLKPPYSSLLQFYQKIASELNVQISQIQGEVRDKHTVTPRPSDERFLTYLKDELNQVNKSIQEIRASQSDAQHAHGYAVLLDVTTGDLGADVRYLRLCSFKSGTLMYVTIANWATGEVSPSVVYNPVSQFLDDSGRAKTAMQAFSEKHWNQNYLSNRTFRHLDIIKRPNVYYYVEVSKDGKRWYSVDAKLVQVYGTIYGTVVSIRDGEQGTKYENKRIMKVVDEFNLSYTSAVADFSNISVGDKVIISKNNCQISFKDGNPIKGVEIINNEGICGTVQIGSKEKYIKYADNIKQSDMPVTNNDDVSIIQALSSAQRLPISSFKSTLQQQLERLPEQLSKYANVLVVPEISNADIFGGGILESGNLVVTTSAYAFNVLTSIGRLVYRKMLSNYDKQKWGLNLAKYVTLTNDMASDEDKFCHAFSVWVKFAYGTYAESSGELNTFMADLFLSSANSDEIVTNYSVLKWEDLENV